jgi:serine-type D-Ala-D-Ala carboxypeptidase (penicillin-binding protein 5/6)
MRRAAALLLASALAGCGAAARPAALAPGSEEAGNKGPLLQVANGPAAVPAAQPGLTLRLRARRDPVRLRFGNQPRAGLLFDVDTGEVLWRRSPERVLAIASLTKMMTALVVVAREPPDAKVLVTKEALAYRGSGMGVLPRGKRVKLETMLNGLMLPSGNDAAIALAQRVSGSVPAFVARMNAEAARMGLRCTRYSSPDGFKDSGNHSCAVDLAIQARAVLDEPRLARIVRRRQAVLPFPMKGGRIYLYNNNPLLRLRYPGTLGIKTGYTRAAGRCLVVAVRRHGRRLGVVLLNSPDPATQARKLFERGFRLRRSPPRRAGRFASVSATAAPTPSALPRR